MSTTVYSYYDSSGLRNYIDDPELMKLGVWSSTGTYFAPPPYSAVAAGNSLYLCITTNTGQNPTIVTMPPRFWSPLVIVSEGTIPTEADLALALAGSAYQIGTNALATAGTALALAMQAFSIGTNAQISFSTGTFLAVTGSIGSFTSNHATINSLSAQNGTVSILTSTQLTAGTIFTDYLLMHDQNGTRYGVSLFTTNGTTDFRILPA